MDIQEFDSASFSEMRKKLIPEHKGNDLQKGFLESVQSKNDFVKWIDSSGVAIDKSNTTKLNLYPEPLTESEFKDTTPDVERIAFETWDGITPRVASRPSFWGALTLCHISNGVIEPSYLAAPNNSSQTGLTRIKTALQSDEPKPIDDAVRTILRRFSGLPEARGELRSIYVNCAFGRAWWRERLVREVLSSVVSGDEEAISRTVRTSQEYWEKLVNLLSTRNSVFGDESIRTCLIWALSEHIDDADYSDLFLATGAIDKCIDLLSIYSAYQEFGIFESKELKNFMKTDIIEFVLKSN